MPDGIKIGNLKASQWQTFIPPEIKATGDIVITSTIAGTASITTKHAAGDILIDLRIEGVATGNNGSIGRIGIPISLAGTASRTDVNRAQGSILKNITIAGQAATEVSMSAELTIPMAVDAFMMVQPVASITLPALTIQASSIQGVTAKGDVKLPALTATALGSNEAHLVLPALKADARAISENQATGRIVLPLLSMTGAFADDRYGSADVILPGLRNNGILVSGAVADTSAELPALRVYGEISGGQLVIGDLVLPALEMSGTTLSESLAVAELVLPAFIMAGYTEETAIVVFSGWSTNTEAIATSEYNNFDYLMVANVFGKYLGVAADGVYELTGPDDNTVNIDADVAFGFDSFRTEDLKRVKAVHLGYRADNDGDLEVQITVDGEDKVRTYPVKHVSSPSGIKRGRATIAKGLKSRYWQYGFLNIDGADFIVDDLNVYVQQHNRKAQ